MTTIVLAAMAITGSISTGWPKTTTIIAFVFRYGRLSFAGSMFSVVDVDKDGSPSQEDAVGGRDEAEGGRDDSSPGLFEAIMHM